MSVVRPLALLLAVSAAALVASCSGGASSDTTVASLRVDLYGFEDDIRGGHVEIRDMGGRAIAELSGDAGETGTFTVPHAVRIPDRFKVIATGLRMPAGAGGDGVPEPSEPSELEAWVENPAGDLLVQVTPLTAFVARYAWTVGVSLAEGEKAILAYLDLPAYMDPDQLVPFDGTPEMDLPFSFTAFRQAWKDSGLPFLEFLDVHVARARMGEVTHEFAGKKGGFGKWLLKAVGKGAMGGVTRQGVGWLCKIIVGAPSMKDIGAQLDVMKQQLDELKDQLNNVQAALTELLQEMRAEARYQALVPAVATIELNYADLCKIPRIPVVGGAQAVVREIDAQSTRVRESAVEIHLSVLPVVGTSFYDAYADHLLNEGRKGRPVRELTSALLDAYTVITGAQAHALILAVEHWQLLHMSDDETMRFMVAEEVDGYRKRIALQTGSFLDAAERIVTALAPNGGASIDYRVGSIFPSDGDSAGLFALVDEAAGDILGAETQLVSRLIWDDGVTAVYSGQEVDPADTQPKNFGEIFGFMRDRMDRLSALDAQGNGRALPLYLVADTGPIYPAAPGKGVLNTFSVTRFKAGTNERIEPPGRVKVLRHVFQDFPVSEAGIRYTILPGGEEGSFAVPAGQVKVRGTVGPRLYGPPPADGITANVSVLATKDVPYLTVPLLAWMPPYLLERPERDTGRTRFLYSNAAADQAGYFVKSEGYGYVASTDRPDLAFCNGTNAFRHTLWRQGEADGKLVRYGEPFNLTIDNGPRMLYVRGGSANYSKSRIPTQTTFKLHPVPDIVRRFVRNPAALTSPQVGVSVYVEDLYYGVSQGLMREIDYCNSLRWGGTEKDGPQRWTFER